MIFKIKYILIFCMLASSFGCHAAPNPNPVYIRTNQVGFRPGDFKTAVIFSEYPLYNKKYQIVNINSGREVIEQEINDSSFTYDKFKHCYTINFSSLKETGKYQIIADGNRSTPFYIKDDVFNNVVDSLMLFFKVQRCGPTNPFLHGPCHMSDATSLVGGNKTSPVDVTGGWHDGGDYIKFLSTAAYTTYLLIFSYEFDKDKFGFDNDKNGVPDILEEAKVGLDWLLRCNYEKYSLITQVQDLRDHENKWRRPENDSLQYDRPGFVGIGKNQVGIFCAALSIASRIWADKFNDKIFSDKCLSAAQNIYSIRDNVPDIENTHSGFYKDKSFWGKLALAAIELYSDTKNVNYLNDALAYGDSAKSDYWWSWGDINSLAQYKIARYNTRYLDYIYNNLYAFNRYKNLSPFNEGLPFTWGTTNSLLGVALQAILFKEFTNDTQFDSLAFYQRDYVLGRNPWGLSFIYNIGSVFARHLHSQIAWFNSGYLPGGLSAGPAPLNVINKYNIDRTDSTYNYFNTDSVKYFDDMNDYITNEPTIGSNATAVFVYGYYSQR
jgi:hypothetical protein